MDIKRISGSGLGARNRQGVRGPGGKRIQADIEITELEPDKLIGFKGISGPVRPVGRYDLALEGDCTRVRFTLRADLSGAKRLMKPMVQKTMLSEVACLDNLKEALEGSSKQR